MRVDKRIHQWYREKVAQPLRAHAILQEWLGMDGTVDQLAELAVARAKDIEMYYKVMKNPTAPEALREIASLRVQLANCRNGKVEHLIGQENRKWWRNRDN